MFNFTNSFETFNAFVIKDIYPRRNLLKGGYLMISNIFEEENLNLNNDKQSDEEEINILTSFLAWHPDFDFESLDSDIFFPDELDI